MGYDEKESERLHADAVARYKGQCDPNLFPVKVAIIKASFGGIWVETGQPNRPEDDEFCFVQEHDVVIELEQDNNRYTRHKYNGPDQGGVPFISDCPVALDEPFICRAKARWGMQDAHPEDRGFMALPGYSGRTYYGNWSEWSEWFYFPSEDMQEQAEREARQKAAIEKATREHEEAVRQREQAEAARAKSRQHEFDTVEEIKKHPSYVESKADLKANGDFTVVDPRAIGAAGASGRYWTQRRWIKAINSWKNVDWLTFEDVRRYLRRIDA